MCRTNSDGVLNLVNLPVSGGGRAFGSVSEIQSGWFVLGVNGKFALDADYLSREGPAVHS